tara:strand:+ start:154 stop:768 length:615 start_codon:yes stop_codon:yes gene_type:complete
MKANDILNKIKNIVGVELSETVELAELTLENGTILVSEEFTKGNAVFIKGEDGEIALPVGEYSLEDGRVLFIVEEGIIDSIRESAETEEKEAEEELSEESVTEETEETVETELEEEEMKYVTKEEFALAMDELKSMIEKMGYKDKEEEEMSKEEVVENKEELSAETVEPIKHNPEAETKNVNFTIAGKRTETTKDRVYNKIFNN